MGPLSLKHVSYNIETHKSRYKQVKSSNSLRTYAMSNDTKDINDITTPIDDRFYRLVDRVPVRCTLTEFATAMQDDTNRIMAQATIKELQISTVFTGINQNWGEGAPILFETMVFGLPDDLQPQWRFSTWDEAMEIHDLLVSTLTEHGAEPLITEIRQKAASASKPAIDPQQS